MKRIIVGGAAAALLCTTACATEDAEDVGVVQEAANNGQTTVFHQQVNGGGAMAFGGSQYGFYHVDVWESSATSAFLSYHVEAVDPTSEVCVTETFPPLPCPPEDPACPCNMDPMLPECQGGEYTYCYYTRYTFDSGWGEIPASDFQIGPNGARLSTTVANTPMFYAEHCVVDHDNWSFQCSPANGGTIDMDWTSNSMYSSFSSGVNKFRFGKYMHISNGQQRHSSADAWGTILGLQADGPGDITSNHNVMIDIMPTDPFGVWP